jgi:hypothetical protein
VLLLGFGDGFWRNKAGLLLKKLTIFVTNWSNWSYYLIFLGLNSPTKAACKACLPKRSGN